MGVCETCGNSYDKTFTITTGAESHVFDCFECAIYRLAPHCAGCDCRVIGHGVEAEGVIYCSAHCATGAGVTSLRDRAESPAASAL
jgi:hypothetical protein